MQSQITNKPTITIAIPAYNEEGNIRNMIESLIKQNIDGLTIDKIIILSDGSTDRTTPIVKTLQQRIRNIQLINGFERKGKVSRLNEIFRKNSSDILFVFDGDIVLASNDTIIQMASVLINDEKALMAASHQIPIKDSTFIGKTIYAAYKVWDDSRLSFPKQNHIQNFYGASTCYRKSFVKLLKIPKQITDERGYIYYMAEKSRGFRYVKNAAIYYRPVGTFAELWKLGDRSFNKNRQALVKLFGTKIIDMYSLPFKYKARAIINNLISDPLYTTLGLFVNILLRVFPVHDKLYEKGMWESSKSTKRAINYD